MKAILFISTVLFLYAPTTYADTFGSDAATFEIEFVPIGNPNNRDDFVSGVNPMGKVEYDYRIGKFEISEDMITKANALTQGEGDPLDITHKGRGANKPVTGLNWFEAAKFVNWLNTSTGHTPAYKFVRTVLSFWQPDDAGYDPANRYRNSQALYFLPSADEWYKAAYYDPTAAVYYDYATGSDSVPDGIDFPGDTSFDAVYYDGGSNPDPNDITDEGLLSPYGTAGQTGNAWEWEETEFDGINDNRFAARSLAGGSWNNTIEALNSSVRFSDDPFNEGQNFGLRVASKATTVQTVPGDFNGDGTTDGRDFLMWQRGESPDSHSTEDLAAWRANYGAASSLGLAQAVPEPATWVLAGCAFMRLLLAGRRW